MMKRAKNYIGQETVESYNRSEEEHRRSCTQMDLFFFCSVIKVHTGRLFCYLVPFLLLYLDPEWWYFLVVCTGFWHYQYIIKLTFFLFHTFVPFSNVLKVCLIVTRTHFLLTLSDINPTPLSFLSLHIVFCVCVACGVPIVQPSSFTQCWYLAFQFWLSFCLLQTVTGWLSSDTYLFLLGEKSLSLCTVSYYFFCDVYCYDRSWEG